MLSRNLMDHIPALSAAVYGCDLGAACLLVMTPKKDWPDTLELVSKTGRASLMTTALSMCLQHAVEHKTTQRLAAWAARNGPEHQVLKEAFVIAQEDASLESLRKRVWCFLLCLLRWTERGKSDNRSLMWGTACDIFRPCIVPALVQGHTLGEFGCSIPVAATKIRISNHFARLV